MLIVTKLRRPRVAEDLLPRPRLYAALERGCSSKLTLVCAAAGYGKSSLVASWLAATERPHIWISLDPSDRDPVQFLGYLAGSLKHVSPHAGGRLPTVLQSATLPPADFVAANLINDLDEVEAPLIIVLDDFHFIESAFVVDLMTALLQYLPAHIHVIIITRKDPDLPLVQMRARQEIAEIRMEQLRFTETEVDVFLRQVLGDLSSSVNAAQLATKTEGWPVGLRLITLAVRRSDTQASGTSFSATGDGFVMNYLLAEVLARVAPGMRTFMLRTAVCDRLCADLCQALLDETDPMQPTESRIEALKRTNLFVVELDEKGEWWRYHHLFQQLLQHQLLSEYSEDEVRNLHRRAGHWYANHGFLDEAFSHALAAQDVPAAVALLEQNRFVMMNRDQWHVLVRWLSQLPEEIKSSRPELILTQAWVAYYHHRMGAIPGLLTLLEEHMEGHPKLSLLQTEAQYFQALQLFWQGESAKSHALLDDVVGRLSAVSDQAGSEANVQRVMTLQMMGRKDVALQSLYRDLYGHDLHGHDLQGHDLHGHDLQGHDLQGHDLPGTTAPSPIRKTRLLAALAFLHLLEGELDAMLETAVQALDVARSINNAYVEAWMHYLQALYYFERNELAAAQACFEHAAAQRYVLHTMAAVDSLAGLAVTYAAQGETTRAEATLALLQEFAAASGELHYVTIARTAQARVLLLAGRIDAAAQRLQTAEWRTDTRVLFFLLEIPRLTVCRVRIARRDRDGLRQCVTMLNRLRATVAAEHNTRQLIEIDTLRAAAYHHLGQEPEARDALSHALALAAPGGWIRPFVEVGPVMVDLLQSVGADHPQREFVARLLAAFAVDGTSPTRVATDRTPDPLTGREQEILELLAERFTNQEIAAQLVISVATVKRHTANIYQKLHVNSRRRAVAKARTMGHLPPV